MAVLFPCRAGHCQSLQACSGGRCSCPALRGAAARAVLALAERAGAAPNRGRIHNYTDTYLYDPTNVPIHLIRHKS